MFTILNHINKHLFVQIFVLVYMNVFCEIKRNKAYINYTKIRTIEKEKIIHFSYITYV